MSQLSRRILLRGLGGACVVAPFLGSLANRGAKAQVAAAPKRLIVQVGSASGYFKTGWAVNVDDQSATLTTGNSEAVCTDGTSETSGTYDSTTGTPASLANAPLNKYHCSPGEFAELKASS
jgi:hypothetical protein